MIDCKYCGRHIPYDANVCPYCARSLKEHKESPSSEIDAPVSEPVKQYVETPVKSNKSNSWLYAIIVILLLMLLSVVGYMLLHGIDFRGTENDIKNDSIVLKQTSVIDEEAATDASVSPKADKKVKNEIIVNGDGVRMRFSPSLKSGYLRTSQGGTLSVTKGTRLPCVGEEGDWYKVVYQGKHYYMSKQYCIPAP